MNIIVVGMGSMGRRRVRLLGQLNQNFTIRGVDLSQARREQAQKELGIDCFSSIGDALKDFHSNCAFISTSPITHEKIALECLENNLNIFTEINLLNNWYEKAMKIANEKNLKIFLSSTFLYRKEIEYIKTAVDSSTVNYIYHTGQYLPDWHPWENYKDFFVSNPKTNGCREIFGIELPWIVSVFGEIVDFSVQKSKLSDLEINYDDNYMVLFTHKNGTKGVMCADVVSRKAVRNLEVYSQNLHLFWDGTPGGLRNFNIENKTLDEINLYQTVDKNSNYASSIIENAYSDEITDFLSMLEANTTPKYSLEKDFKILNLIDKIEGIAHGI